MVSGVALIFLVLLLLSDALDAFVQVNLLLHEVTICLHFPPQDTGTLFVPGMSKKLIGFQYRC
jgi:hypothetical protein